MYRDLRYATTTVMPAVIITLLHLAYTSHLS